MTTPRAVHTETALADGTILVAGGCTNAGCGLGSPASDTAEIFDPATGRFTRVGRMSSGSRDDHVAVLLRDGRVLLAGRLGCECRRAARHNRAL